MNRLFACAGIALLAIISGESRAQQGTGSGAQGTGQAGAKGTPGQAGSTMGGINRTPWFSDPALRRELKFTDQQFDRLNKVYGQAWTSYEKGMSGLDKVSEAERARRMQDLSGTFNRDFMKSFEGVIEDPQQRQRFSQLYNQYRGYDTFRDPTIQQQLKLTPEQQQVLRKHSQQYSEQLQNIGKTYQTDQDAATRRFNELRKEHQDRIQSMLNEQQQGRWREIIGDPYTFQPSLYFPGRQNETPKSKTPGR